MKKQLLALYLMLISVASCSDPIRPSEQELDVCARAGACEVHGVDLVIDEMSLAFAPGYPRDVQTGLHWVQIYDSVPVRYRVRNRGDQASSAATGWLMSCDGCGPGINGRDLPVRALEPGAVDSGVVMVAATHGFFVSSAPVLDLDVPGRSVDEPFYRNNRRATAQSYLTVAPDIRGTLEILSPEVRVGSPLRMVVTLRNYARHAILRNDSVAFCFRRIESYGLGPCEAAFGLRRIPALGPDQRWSDTVDVQLSAANYIYEKHRTFTLRLDACLNGGTTSRGEQPCGAGSNVVLRPNLESVCSITRLTPGVTVSDTVGQQYPSCYHYLGRYKVYSFEARAGVTYQAQVTSAAPGDINVSIWNGEGEQAGTGGDRTASATIAAAGRYYIVLYRSGISTTPFEVVLSESR